MIFIRFGDWNSSYGRYFVWKRIYVHGYKWTPFVRVSRRAIRENQIEINEFFRPKVLPPFDARIERESDFT